MADSNGIWEICAKVVAILKVSNSLSIVTVDSSRQMRWVAVNLIFAQAVTLLMEAKRDDSDL